MTNILKEMELEKPHAKFDSQQRDQTETRRENREDLEGQKVMNPSENIPKFLDSPEHSQDITKLLTMAQDQKYVPTKNELAFSTNFLLVRLCVMRGKRKVRPNKLFFCNMHSKCPVVHKASSLTPKTNDPLYIYLFTSRNSMLT